MFIQSTKSAFKSTAKSIIQRKKTGVNYEAIFSDGRPFSVQVAYTVSTMLLVDNIPSRYEELQPKYKPVVFAIQKALQMKETCNSEVKCTINQCNKWARTNSFGIQHEEGHQCEHRGDYHIGCKIKKGNVKGAGRELHYIDESLLDILFDYSGNYLPSKSSKSSVKSNSPNPIKKRNTTKINKKAFENFSLREISTSTLQEPLLSIPQESYQVEDFLTETESMEIDYFAGGEFQPFFGGSEIDMENTFNFQPENSHYQYALEQLVQSEQPEQILSDLPHPLMGELLSMEPEMQIFSTEDVQQKIDSFVNISQDELNCLLQQIIQTSTPTPIPTSTTPDDFDVTNDFLENNDALYDNSQQFIDYSSPVMLTCN